MIGLEFTPIHFGWRYRTAFLISLALGIFQVVLRWRTPAPFPFWVDEISGTVNLTFQSAVLIILAAFLGALIGGLTATSLQEGLWEDNSPPSEQIQESVQFQHSEVIESLRATPISKRLFDILVSGFGLFISAPVWIVSLFLIWFEDPGPLLFVKNSVGKGGQNFHQFKLRTMVRGAEDATGPIMAQERDVRVLVFGKFLRKTALDELPQLINILHGEMSIVGPRPQRTVLVYEYLKEIPEYALRHQVLPGLAGLAQVVGHYYLTPRQKLRFDRLYIQHQNLTFDFRILVAAFLITFGYRWKRNWDGRLPRKLLHG